MSGINIDGLLNQANGRLKSSRIRLRIQNRGSTLALLGTLPPKPGSPKQHPHQQRIALGLSANPIGVSLAEKEARKVAVQLDMREFSWEPYLRETRSNPVSTEDWIQELSRQYFLTHPKNPQSRNTWRIDYEQIYRRLSPDKPPSKADLEKIIAATQPNSRSRKRVCQALQLLAKSAGIEGIDFAGLKGKYSASRVSPRSIPPDEKIVEIFHLIEDENWRWVLGMLAAFGLRPHEVFFVEWNDEHSITITEGKTGERQVWAIWPEWVKLFDLRNGEPPSHNRKDKSHIGLGQVVSKFFTRLPFNAYDLRHAWSIRAIEFGLDTTLAAKQQGHSVRVHEETYQRWLDREIHERAYERLLAASKDA